METTELQRLACMGNALRPDWPSRSLLSFLTKHFENRAYGDVAVALAWIASRTKTDTPRLLLEAGPWWKACQVDGTTAPRNYDVPCSEHPDQTIPCDKCANARVPAEEPTALALARAELQSARSRLCPHGVNRKIVRCGDCALPRPTPTEPTEESAG